MPDGITVPKYTECKLEMCGGQPTGWTMIQKRYDGSVDFNQNWNAYRSGFGCVAESASISPFEGGKVRKVLKADRIFNTNFFNAKKMQKKSNFPLKNNERSIFLILTLLLTRFVKSF